MLMSSLRIGGHLTRAVKSGESAQEAFGTDFSFPGPWRALVRLTRRKEASADSVGKGN